MKIEDFDFPDDLLYMKGHVWVKVEGGLAYMGITSLGASLAKEIVHVDLPGDGEEFKALEPMASFETIKSVTEVLAPSACRILGVNENLLDDPSLINSEPYEGGWILRLEFLDENRENLMDALQAAEYFKKILSKEKERFAGIYD